MEWTRSETIALAAPKCASCHGAGLLLGRRGQTSPCRCVLRAVFRTCFARFVECATREPDICRARIEQNGRYAKPGYGLKNEEYIADFCLIARRTLSENEYRIFRYHFLLSADWRLCARFLKIDRGTLFHCLYRIQEKLGRVFCELEPYALYPVDEYFTRRVQLTTPCAPPVVRFQPVRPEMKPPASEEGTEPLEKSA